MKNLTKCVLLVLISMISFQVNAQSLRLKGGLNLANMMEKDDNNTYSDDYKMNLGFHVGFVYDIPLSDILSLEPGLLIETKGFKIKESFGGISIVGKLNLVYADIPVMLKAGYELSNGMKIYGALGPYVGVGLFGKIVAKAEGERETETVEWGSDENESMIKRLDFGLGFGGGIEVNQVLVGIGYDLGLANVSPYTDGGAKAKHRVLKISVGYIF